MYDISDAVYRLAPCGSYLLFLGGDHFITYPIMKGLNRGRPGKYGLVWFDAHADFYSSYAGYKMSHATTLHNIVSNNLVLLENVVAYDLRAALYSQLEELYDGGSRPVHDLDSFIDAINEVATRVDALHVTVDLDVLRPEVAPGVAHPESGGLTPEELFKFLHHCFTTGKVFSVDVVEMNPMLDSGVTAITARDIVKQILAGFGYQKSMSKP